jgi:hypothetical protein
MSGMCPEAQLGPARPAEKAVWPPCSAIPTLRPIQSGKRRIEASSGRPPVGRRPTSCTFRTDACPLCRPAARRGAARSRLRPLPLTHDLRARTCPIRTGQRQPRLPFQTHQLGRSQLLGRLLRLHPLRHIVRCRRHRTPTFLAERRSACQAGNTISRTVQRTAIHRTKANNISPGYTLRFTDPLLDLGLQIEYEVGAGTGAAYECLAARGRFQRCWFVAEVARHHRCDARVADARAA